MSESILSCQSLTKRYGSQMAVNGLTFEVNKGQVYGLLGPNGSGKTTTLSMALGVIQPTSGNFQWFNEGCSNKQRMRIGALLEGPQFYPWMSATQSLKLVATVRSAPSSDIERVLRLVDLWERKSEKYANYSLGMKQRLGIASCLLGDPDVLVLDEPTNGIDAEGIAEIRRIILEQKAKGKTILLASHILDEVEKVCSHVAVLKQGKLLQSGSIQEVLSQNSWFEVAAKNLVELTGILKSYPRVQSIQAKEGCLQVFSDATLTAEELNRFCFDKGITLSQLRVCHQSLEEHFLEVLKQ